MTNKAEPAVIAGTISAALAVLLSFGVPGLSVETVALIMTLVNAVLGLYVAWKVHATSLALVLGVVNAGFALASGYGFDLSQGQQAALLGLLSVVIGMFIRTQATPLAQGSLSLKTSTG